MKFTSNSHYVHIRNTNLLKENNTLDIFPSCFAKGNTKPIFVNPNSDNGTLNYTVCFNKPLLPFASD